MLEWLILTVLAVVMEFIDSFLGMMYGTVLSPLLILFGYNAKTVVPVILISQAVGGFVASWRHHTLRNASFKKGTADWDVFHSIVWLGVVAAIIGVFISIKIPVKYLNTYIALLVIFIAIMIFLKKTFVFTRFRIFFLGFVSAFNKALSGGGFGPLVAGGQLVFEGRDEKGAIGSTDFAEAPICLVSFALWVFAKGCPPVSLIIPMCIGSAIGGFFGPKALSLVVSRQKLKLILAVLIFVEGVSVLYKVWIK